jgi:alginate O-acetyltransferase complex protein AlgI
MITSWQVDFYNSAAFWGVLVAVVVLVRLLGTSGRVKGLALLVLSSALILAIPGFGIGGLTAVLGFAGVTLWAARRLCRPGDDRPAWRRLIVILGVLAVLGFLGFFKYQFLQGLLIGPLVRDALIARPSGTPTSTSSHIFLIGVSYFSFKAIHTIVEAYRRSIPAVEGLVYLNYITFFPAFVSGPISRYPHFAAQMGPVERGTLRRDLAQGGERIVHGLFKKLVLVKLIFPYVLGQGTPLGAMGAGEVAVGLYAYALYFYFDFAGYTDMAIGAARLMGMELPENFNRPFLQKNIRELWSSWHMSLTNWLVDYIYWPLVRKLRNREFFQARPVLLSIVGMNATFIACGAWHGEAFHFILWGIYHGMGISLLMLYQRQKRSIRVPAVQRYFRSRASHVVGAVGTFHFFALGLALFVLDLQQLRELLGAFLR